MEAQKKIIFLMTGPLRGGEGKETTTKKKITLFSICNCSQTFQAASWVCHIVCTLLFFLQYT